MESLDQLKEWANNHLTPEVVSSQRNIIVWSAACGILAHQYFKRFETDPISYVVFTLYLSAAVGYCFYQYAPLPILHTLEALLVFDAFLLGSIGVYRLSPWHPLANYPGPTSAKLSKVYWWRQAQLGRTGYTQAELHKRFDSDFVRLGPNWISIRSADAIPIIYGGSKATGRHPFRKSDWYEGSIRGATRISMHQEVDVEKHALRRRRWDLGFSGPAMASYKPEILQFCDMMARNVAAAASKQDTIDMALISTCFSFDVMGVLGFGASFGMLDTSRKHFFVETLENAMQTLVAFYEIPWIRILLRKVLPLPERLKKFEQQNIERFERRLAQGSSRRDLFTYLLGEENESDAYKLTRAELIADTGLIVVAGSDTTSSLLTWFWYYNATNQAEYSKLQAELDRLPLRDRSDTGVLSRLPYLNAALNETMRMQPAVPGGLRRIVPEGGVTIDGHYIPGGTTVSVPGYAIQHDARWWGNDENVYRPERWLDQEGHSKTAFLPFSYGTRACPGKGLALTAARLAVADLATRFNFTLPAGFSCRHFEEGVRDHFTIQNAPLPLNPTPRNA